MNRTAMNRAVLPRRGDAVDPRHTDRGRSDGGTVAMMPATVTAALALATLPLLGAATTLTGTTPSCATRTSGSAANSGENTIPATYLTLYQSAGKAYGLPWTLLAAIGKVESDHGRGTDPGIRSGANTAGAMGPMQFLAPEWRTYGVDGDHDGTKNVYDPADAIPAAAAKLRHDGAPANTTTAIYHYNPAWDYVRHVQDWATRYTDGHYTPTGCPTTSQPAPTGRVAKVLAFARAQLGKPYVWGATGPAAYDCSGLVWAAYRAAGIHLARTTYDMWPAYHHIPHGQEQPGDLVYFSSSGTQTHPGHMGLVIGGGKMIVAPHTGAVVRIEPYTRPDLVGFNRP